MAKFLAVFLGILAFLIVCLYWLWQMATGQPALPLEEVALRAVGAMVAVCLLGLVLGRLGGALIAEAWHESQARAKTGSGPARIAFGGGGAPAGGKDSDAKRTD